MNPIKLTFIFALQIIAGPALLFSDSGMTLLKNSAIWIEGDSTLHRFSSTSTAFAVEIDADPTPRKEHGNAFYDSFKNKELKKFTLRLPANTLKSGKSPLDKNMMEALNAKNYPEILFQMKDLPIS